MQCQSTPGTAGAMGERASDEPLPAAIEDTVAAAIEDGATMDEILARVRLLGPAALGGDRSPLIPRARRCARDRPDEGRWAEPMQGLICLQRETDRFSEEWERTRDPRAEGLSALIAIETLRTLALRTMAELGAREEPVPTEDLGRLALALHRIESADKLRIEREQAAADAAAAHAGPAARAAGMTHAERVETVRWAMEGHLFPGGTDPPPPASGWAAETPPADTRRHPAGAGARVACRRPSREFTCHSAGAGARFACRRRGAGRWDGALDVCDGRDSWDAHRARDAELRRREAEGRLWPTDPPFCPAAVERARVRPGGSHPPQPGTRCRRHNHAIWSERKDTPTSPRPSPPPGAERERRPAPSTYPLRPSGGRGTGRGGFVVCAVLCDHARNLVRDLALASATLYAARTTLRACATLSRGIPLIPLNPT